MRKGCSTSIHSTDQEDKLLLRNLNKKKEFEIEYNNRDQTKTNEKIYLPDNKSCIQSDEKFLRQKIERDMEFCNKILEETLNQIFINKNLLKNLIYLSGFVNKNK
jgi:hypothetical protein